MAASHSLPLELITEILTKLPVKSLNRFKCVSKAWNSIITSSKFIKHHLHQTLISNSTTTNILISYNSILSAAISDVELRFNIVNHPLNNLPHRPPIDILESVHGVLLIVDSSKKTVCLFNPSNKTHRLVPPASASSHMPACNFEMAEVFGFGYDGVTDDYKVVRLIQWDCECSGSGLFRETSVYSMRNDSWESVKDETVAYTLQPMDAVAVDGILSFVVISTDSKPVLKCFDLSISTFTLVDYPELDSYDLDMMTTSFSNLRGCLCLLVTYHEQFMGDPLYNCRSLYTDMWEMNECKWIKLFRIQNNEIPKECMYLKHVTFSKDMKRVLLEVDGNWFGWYDLVTKRIESVPVQGLGVEDSPFVACTYVESLVSVLNNKVVSEKEITKPKKNDFLSSGFKLKL